MQYGARVSDYAYENLAYYIKKSIVRNSLSHSAPFCVLLLLNKIRGRETESLISIYEFLENYSIYLLLELGGLLSSCR